MSILTDLFGAEPSTNPTDLCGCGSGLPANTSIPRGRGRLVCCHECYREWQEMADDEAFDRQWDTIANYWTVGK